MASWCLRLGRATKLRASSSRSRCCGLGVTDVWCCVRTLEEVAHLDAQGVSDAAQPTRGDPVDALLVLVRLLIGDPDQLGQLLLAQAQHHPPLAHLGPDIAVNVLCARAGCRTAWPQFRHR